MRLPLCGNWVDREGTVVSDTSPITNLAAIGQFALLRQVVGPIVIADAVWEELNVGANIKRP